MKSKYNIETKVKGGYLIFNILHQNLFYIKNSDFNDYSYEKTTNPNFDEWQSEGLIIDDQIDEYQEKYQKIYAKSNKKRQIITFFTTTACNARCSYCFEKGIQTLSINPKDIEKLSNVVINSINCEHLHITWFGGEPLLFPNAITEITNIVKPYCEQNSIKYTSSIITNGSLITPEIKEKMFNEWNIVSTQITLDGTKNKYNKIKSYVDGSDFQKVISNIKLLTQDNHKITIRINFDKYNLTNCLKLVKYLYKNDLRSDKINIYFSPITNQDEKSKKLINRQYKQIFDVLIKYKYLRNINYFNFHLAEKHCQAEQEQSFCLFPNGIVTKCQRQKPQNSKISIYDEDFLNKLNISWQDFESTKPSEKCIECKYLPLCCGGCKINDFSKLTKNHCDRCYMYSDSFPAIMYALNKLYLK